jgi:hypothetical protein
MYRMVVSWARQEDKCPHFIHKVGFRTEAPIALTWLTVLGYSPSAAGGQFFLVDCLVAIAPPEKPNGSA